MPRELKRKHAKYETLTAMVTMVAAGDAEEDLANQVEKAKVGIRKR